MAKQLAAENSAATNGTPMTKADELLLHIGQEKTGTTTLQSTLIRARLELREQGILLPYMHPHAGNSLLLAYTLFGHKDANIYRQSWLEMDLAQLIAASEQAWNDIQATVAKAPPEKILISSELFFRPMTSATIRAANQMVNQVAKSSRIVAYLRAPDAYFLSHTQQTLKDLSLCFRPSRTLIKDTVAPLIKGWEGPVSLNVFDRHVMKGGDIVTDFVTRYFPAIDPATIERLRIPYNATLSAEAMSVLFDISSGKLVWGADRHGLAIEVMKADRRIDTPTKPKLHAAAAQTLINWRAPDLFWLRDEHGITFPSIDYAVIDPNEVDDGVFRIDGIEELCDVNNDRKAMLLRRAMGRARLPKSMRRLLFKY
ncbi:MAG: hypothetical protein QNL92_08355 [Octadecabacter sp.]